MSRGVILRLGCAWLALLLLLALTCGSAFLSLGRWNIAINLGIAALKALLVAFAFMELRSAVGAVKVVAVIGLVMLAILAGLTATDLAPRYGQSGGPRIPGPP